MALGRHMEHQMSMGVPWEIWEQQWQQSLQVDFRIQSDTTSPRRHLGCHPRWVWDRTGANMAVYPHSTTHLPQLQAKEYAVIPLIHSIWWQCCTAAMAAPRSILQWNRAQHLPLIKYNQAICDTAERGLALTVECSTKVLVPYVEETS